MSVHNFLAGFNFNLPIEKSFFIMIRGIYLNVKTKRFNSPVGGNSDSRLLR